MTDPVQVRSFDGIAQVLGGPEFEPVTYAERHRMLGARLGFDVSEILRAIRAIPLCQRGAAHAETRRRLAGLIAEGSGRVAEFSATELPEMVRRLFEPGRHDVMGEFIHPCVDRILEGTIGLAPQAPGDTVISRVFSQSMGVARRRRMNSELGALRARLSEAFPQMSTEETDDRIALSILGTDTLRGTIGCSLHAVLTGGADGGPRRDHASLPPRTGVPYIDREAMVPTVVEGQAHDAGVTFRACLEALEAADMAGRMRFWGFGAHTCLGRRMSLQVWRGITAELTRLAPQVEVTRYTLARDDVFAIPDCFEIEVG